MVEFSPWMLVKKLIRKQNPRTNSTGTKEKNTPSHNPPTPGTTGTRPTNTNTAGKGKNTEQGAESYSNQSSLFGGSRYAVLEAIAEDTPQDNYEGTSMMENIMLMEEKEAQAQEQNIEEDITEDPTQDLLNETNLQRSTSQADFSRRTYIQAPSKAHLLGNPSMPTYKENNHDPMKLTPQAIVSSEHQHTSACYCPSRDRLLTTESSLHSSDPPINTQLALQDFETRNSSHAQAQDQAMQHEFPNAPGVGIYGSDRRQQNSTRNLVISIEELDKNTNEDITLLAISDYFVDR
ncbi:hypothetical protein Cgig2_032167 [Carnegiea gigantea]|uniref:Uncharacterized protein n=1 Tax=Carnegiea gigantea TaxID=171969 RepID=A0A9Q1K8Y0_9CARY|nr:hypothetical protein Cgig2_032167 [Carnegiea gigantea]